MKRIMRVFILTLALVLTFSLLVACGGGEDEGGESIRVVYNLYGGTLPDGAPESYKEGGAPDFSKVIPTMENYSFDGWYTDDEYTVPLTTPSPKDGKITLYAKWTGAKYPISYELFGGEGDNLPTEYSFGDWVNLSTLVPTKAGYLFAGWYYDAVYTSPAELIDDETSGEISVYAKWVPAVTKLSEISNVKKGFFGEGYSSFSIDLSKYVVNEQNVTVSYRAESSNISVAEVSVSGSVLTVELLRGIGESVISVDAFVDSVLCAEFEFTATSKTYTRIACVGDSLTASAPCYTSSLQAYFEDSGVVVGNFGKSAASVSPYTNGDYYDRYTIWGKTEYDASLVFNPDLIIIMLGTNDATKIVDGEGKYDWAEVAPSFVESYIDLINDYKTAYPDADIVIMTSPEVLPDNTLSISNDLMERYTYPLQLEIASTAGVDLIDLRTYLAAFENKAEFYKDGVHFNELGADTIADFVLKSI